MEFPHNYIEFVQAGFYGLISFIMVYGLNLFKGIKKSIDELNHNVTVLIEKTTWHEKELQRINSRLDSIK